MRQTFLLLLMVGLLEGCDGLPWHCHSEIQCDLNEK